MSRSLHSKTEQRTSRSPDALLKQQRRRAKQARRKLRQRRRGLPAARDARDIDVAVAEGALELVASDMHVGVEGASTSGHGHVYEADVVPLTGRKRDLESGSDSEPALAGDSTLAIVPLKVGGSPVAANVDNSAVPSS